MRPLHKHCHSRAGAAASIQDFFPGPRFEQIERQPRRRAIEQIHSPSDGAAGKPARARQLFGEKPGRIEIHEASAGLTEQGQDFAPASGIPYRTGGIVRRAQGALQVTACAGLVALIEQEVAVKVVCVQTARILAQCLAQKTPSSVLIPKPTSG